MLLHAILEGLYVINIKIKRDLSENIIMGMFFPSCTCDVIACALCLSQLYLTPSPTVFRRQVLESIILIFF